MRNIKAAANNHAKLRFKSWGRNLRTAVFCTSTILAEERLRMPPKSREVKRPRLALSCVVCRRRKVRCGKELPQCHNCERLGNTCVYNTGTRDPSTGRVLRVVEEHIRGSTETLRDDGNVLSRPDEYAVREDGQDKTPELEVSGRERDLPPEHLSTQRGSRSRYIGRSFWASVSGQEQPNDFFYDEPEGPTDLPPPHLSFTLLAKTLHALPKKLTCDVLLNSFFTGVYPVYSLIDATRFRSNYHEFWDWCGKDNCMPIKALVQDPTFICLLFAVLLAGASVASETSRNVDISQKPDTNDTANQLRGACLGALTACRYTQHPTLNTLIASILVHHFTKKESIEMAMFVSTVTRLAQTMGLHQEWDLHFPDVETRRRVWWHIIWLDVQTSISSGLPICCGGDMLGGVQMPSGTDEDSVIMLYATGQCKATKLQSQIILQFQGTRTISQGRIAELATSKDQLDHSIDNLISKIPVQGFPERGMFPSSFTNASPQTLSSLYDDQAKDPSVLGAWARIMLSLLKLETTIMLQKPLLESPDSPNAQPPWQSIAQLCLDYLKIYLLLRTPIFEPYAWFYSQCYGPRQCVLLIMLFLFYHRHSKLEDEQAMMCCVDETLEYCASRQRSLFGSEEQTESQLALKSLAHLRKELDKD